MLKYKFRELRSRDRVEPSRIARTLDPPIYRTVVLHPDNRRTQFLAGPHRGRWIAVGLDDRYVRRSVIPRFL